MQIDEYMIKHHITFLTQYYHSPSKRIRVHRGYLPAYIRYISEVDNMPMLLTQMEHHPTYPHITIYVSYELAA